MKPIIINNFEDLALAIKLSEAQRQREKRARFAAMFSGPPQPLLKRKPYPMDYKRQATFIVTSNDPFEFPRISVWPPMQADEMAAAGFGIDFGALEDSRAFVKVQDSYIEVIPDTFEAHKNALAQCPPLNVAHAALGCAIDALKTAQDAKAKR